MMMVMSRPPEVTFAIRGLGRGFWGGGCGVGFCGYVQGLGLFRLYVWGCSGFIIEVV